MRPQRSSKAVEAINMFVWQHLILTAATQLRPPIMLQLWPLMLPLSFFVFLSLCVYAAAGWHPGC